MMSQEILGGLAVQSGWDGLLHRLAEWTGFAPEFVGKLLVTLGLLAVYVGLRLFLGRLVARRVAEPTKQYMVRRTLTYILSLLVALVLLSIWIRGVQIGTFLGLLTAGLAIALQEPLVNLAGWLFILVRQPFKIGDRIQVGEGQAGDVIDARLFMFSILEIGNWVTADQSTGRIIHVPNSVVFRSPIANYTQGFKYLWNEIPVVVTFESDWKKALEILEQIVAEHTRPHGAAAEEEVLRTAKKFMIFYTHLKPIVWVSVVDSGVQLTMRYICDARKRRSSTDEIWRKVLEQFGNEPAIDFAYPTQRFYDNRAEGKSGAGGPPA